MNALRSRREITSEISMFDTEAKGYNVILSEAKNLGSFLDHSQENKSEMFRFAQHDRHESRNVGGLIADSRDH